jgi:hypothetical protein
LFLHRAQRECQQRSERGVGCRTERQVICLQVTNRSLAAVPTDEEQRGPVPARGIRRIVHPGRYGVRLSVGAAEGGGALVDLLIAAEGRVVDYFRRRDSFTTLPTMNTMLAGRSARRRIRYGYQCVPNGTYTRTLYPSRRSACCKSRRTPYNIWNS